MYAIRSYYAPRRTAEHSRTCAPRGDNGTPSSIIGQLSALIDDNADNNALNDVSSVIRAQYLADGTMIVDLRDPSLGYTFAIEDNGSNFAGAMGLNRFFDGSSARNNFV